MRRDRWPAVLAGILAAAVGVGTAELAAGLLPGSQSLLTAIGDAVIRATPGPVVAIVIAILGGASRLVLTLTMVLTAVAAAGLAGLAAARRWWLGGLVFGAFGVVGAGAGLADPLLPPATALVAPAVGLLVALAALGALLVTAPPPARQAAPAAPNFGRQAAPASPQPERQAASTPALPSPRVPRGSRRAFLTFAAAATGAAVVTATTGRGLQQRAARLAAIEDLRIPPVRNPLPPPPRTASFDVEGLSPLITPNDRFYRIDTAFTVPRINPDEHTVRIIGMVSRPFELSYAELLDRADTEVDVHLACVSNEVGGDLVGNARWLGVPLAELLDEAGVHPTATQLVGRAVDDWTAGFPVAAARDGRPALVAIGMNGEPLPADHGFPVRLVVAGLYGYVSDTKWLSELELTTFEAYDAYWIRRGWAREGPIKTQSRIDVPRQGAQLGAGEVVVAGVAWAGERGIARVEVAVDGTWHEAELAEELATTSWRQWRMRWSAEPGQHELAVRATDGDGETQTAELAPPQPDGATGHHTITVGVA